MERERERASVWDRLRLGRLAIATYVTFYCREGISDDYSDF